LHADTVTAGFKDSGDRENGVSGNTEKDMAESGRMVKMPIKSLKNKPLNPGILESFTPTKLEKNLDS
jgi:hypothetical protein